MEYYNPITGKEDVQTFKISKPANKRSQHLHRKSIYKKELEFEDRNVEKITNFYKECTKDSGFANLLVNSSTSLVLKKKKERNISEKKLFLSYGSKLSDTSKSEIVNTSTNHNTDPLIKVTVIPRCVYTQTSSPQCDYSTKFVQHSSSHENHFKTKRIYLVVAGSKKEKIYELETTGSGKFKNDNIPFSNKEIAINRLCIKRFVDFLNMEKKKRKQKTNKVDGNMTKHGTDNENTIHRCTCVGSKKINNEEGLRKTADDICGPTDGLQCPKDSFRGPKDSFRGPKDADLGWTIDDLGRPADDICGTTDGLRRPKDDLGWMVDDLGRTVDGLGRSADDHERSVQGHGRPPNEVNGLRPSTDCGVPPKSRVRITGHLGVTDEDSYVLKCAASVDGKLVTNLCADEKKNKRESTTTQKTRYGKDTQPVCEYGLIDYLSSCSRRQNMLAKGSQSTQVNFTSNIIHKNQEVQCDGSSGRNQRNGFDTVDQNELMSLEDDSSLKECQSLVVVISVCPKQDVPGKQKNELAKTHTARIKTELNPDCCEVPIIKKCEQVKTHTPRMKTTSSPYYYKTQQNHTPYEKRPENKIKERSYSRSPSPPVKLPAKLKPYTANFEVNKNTNRTRPLSPKAQTPVSANRPTKQRIYSPQMKKKEVISGNATVTDTKIPGWRGKHIKTKENKSTNTEHALAKRMLIDDFLKSSFSLVKTENAETNTSKKFNEVSNVNINIDGEHEYYDVQYRQGIKSSDLKVKKSIKKQKKYRNYEYNSPSMENFLLFPNGGRTRNRSFSQTIFDAQMDNMPKLNKIEINLRESLAISPRREEKLVDGIVSSMGINSFNDENNYENSNLNCFAPVKHYRGDNCSIIDPMERDKEIRELLGVELLRSKNVPKSTRENIIGDHPTTTKNIEDSGINNPIEMDQKENKISRKISNKKVNNKNKQKDFDLVHNGVYYKSVFTQYEICAQIGGNMFTRSIQSYLQNHEKRPIVLTRKQYKKMKKVLQVKRSKKRCNKRYSGVSVGEVRQKFKTPMSLHYDKEVQTDIIELKCKQIQQTDLSFDDSSHNTEPMATLSDALIEHNNDTDSIEVNNDSKSLGSNKQSDNSEQAEIKSLYQSVRYDKRNEKLDVINKKSMENIKVEKSHLPTRQTVSSVEIRYASIAYKHVTFSNSTIGDNVMQPSITKNTLDKDCTSVQTIYKRSMCAKKSLPPSLERSVCPTPNLGKSAFSFFSEDTNFTPVKHIDNNLTDLKERKPFLKRLMSCLVMRSTRVAEVKNAAKNGDEPCKVAKECSVDSYYINTSIGAMEISSSLYDTSASFFSNHTCNTIYPVLNNKFIKRGFLSSMRGLLSNRK